MEAWSRLGNTDDLAHENSHRGQWREGGLARSFLASADAPRLSCFFPANQPYHGLRSLTCSRRGVLISAFAPVGGPVGRPASHAATAPCSEPTLEEYDP